MTKATTTTTISYLFISRGLIIIGVRCDLKSFAGRRCFDYRVRDAPHFCDLFIFFSIRDPSLVIGCELRGGVSQFPIPTFH